MQGLLGFYAQNFLDLKKFSNFDAKKLIPKTFLFEMQLTFLIRKSVTDKKVALHAQLPLIDDLSVLSIDTFHHFRTKKNLSHHLKFRYLSLRR